MSGSAGSLSDGPRRRAGRRQVAPDRLSLDGPSLLVSPADPTNPTLSTIRGDLRRRRAAGREASWPGRSNMPARVRAPSGWAFPLDGQCCRPDPPSRHVRLLLPPVLFQGPDRRRARLHPVPGGREWPPTSQRRWARRAGAKSPRSMRAPRRYTGDANLDKTVNGADLNTVLSNYNQTGKNWAQGDFDGNGTVNGADLNTVLSNYNQSAAGATAAVPEPSALVLLGVGAISLLAYAWRRGGPDPSPATQTPSLAKPRAWQSSRGYLRSYAIRPVSPSAAHARLVYGRNGFPAAGRFGLLAGRCPARRCR